jgi:hypothetical protein
MPSLLATSLFARQNPLDDARTTFSSWDNCMAKAYCKWPVIAAIIIGGLILFSVITCIARCICCGAECACCCFRCCTSCCGGGGGGRKSHKRINSEPARPYPQSYGPPPPANPYAQAHAAAPPAPVFAPQPVNQQYRSNPMPTFTPAAQPERPQFATFDSSKAVVNEDSLPAMPTWKDGRDVHVEVEEQPVPQKKGDVEMDRLDHNGSVTSGSMAAAAVPGTRRSPGPGRSTVSPNHGYPPNGSFVSDSTHYNDNQGQYGQPYGQQGGYRQGSPPQNQSPVYGAGAGYAPRQQQPYGRGSPGPSQAYGSHDQLSQHYEQHVPYQQPQTSYNHPAPYNNHQDPYDQRDYPDEPSDYSAPAPVSNPYGYNASIAPSYHTHDPAPVQQQPSPPPDLPPPSLTPGRPTQASSPVSAYPGQRSYTPAADTATQPPQQQTYRAFTPGAERQQQQQQQPPLPQQYTGVSRKAVDGSYREI